MFGNTENAYLERFRAASGGLFPVGDGTDDRGEAVPRYTGQHGGRRFVGAQAVIVAGPDDAEAQVDAVLVHARRTAARR